jgi:hypothetical protein
LDFVNVESSLDPDHDPLPPREKRSFYKWLVYAFFLPRLGADLFVKEFVESFLKVSFKRYTSPLLLYFIHLCLHNYSLSSMKCEAHSSKKNKQWNNAELLLILKVSSKQFSACDGKLEFYDLYWCVFLQTVCRCHDNMIWLYLQEVASNLSPSETFSLHLLLQEQIQQISVEDSEERSFLVHAVVTTWFRYRLTELRMNTKQMQLLVQLV